jgi:hypothetical protein
LRRESRRQHRSLRYPPPVIDRSADPRTDDTLVYELLATPRGGTEPEVIGRAIFRGGRSHVEAPEAVRVAVEELLSRAFVDRVQADERPRGYRRSGRGMVDMLVPGMPEHFIARLRGLWLSYPDGSVVTARAATGGSSTSVAFPESTDVGPPVTDARLRRATLVAADRTLGTRPLVLSHPPESGLRPEAELAPSTVPVSRTDCGWLV